LKWNDSISRKIQVAYMKLVKEDFFEPQRHKGTEKHKEITA